MMLLLISLVAILGLVEIGFLYWLKREVQKTADLSALAGAQRLDQCSSGNSDNFAARRNALNENGFKGSVGIQCGNWDPLLNPGNHFIAGGGRPLNAVRVVAERGAIPFFGQNPSLPKVSAQAIAYRSKPTAAFSVGSQLARFNNNTPLGSILSLVGVNLDRTTLLGYDGLAQVNVTPAGLLEALGIPVDASIGVAELNQTLAARKVSLGQLLNASATAVGRDGVARAQINALGQQLRAKLKLDNADIQLGSVGSAGNGGSLFAQIIAPGASGASALQANVNVLDLITGGIALSNGRRAVDIPGLGIPGAVVKAGIIEPPSIAIGGIGVQAYNAQVRVNIDVDSNEVPLAGSLLSLLGTRLKLPIYLDLTNALGTLTGIQCGANPRTATVEVKASLLNACVGALPGDPFSTQKDCRTNLGEESLLTLFGQAVIKDKIVVQGLANSPQSLTLAVGDTKSTTINEGAIGNTVADLTTELLRVLSGLLNPTKGKGGGGGGDTSNVTTARNLAAFYLKEANPGTGRYDIGRTIKLLRDGNKAKDIEPLGQWTVPNGQPYACGLLFLATCFRDGDVWDSFESTVTGKNLGALDGLLGGLLGGLLINRCNSLLGGLTPAQFNECVQGNLASYIQTKPDGFVDPTGNQGGILDPNVNSVSCSGLLCTLLKPALNALKPILNAVGKLLLETLANLLGIQIGRSDVHMQSIQCSSAQLVY